MIISGKTCITSLPKTQVVGLKRQKIKISAFIRFLFFIFRDSNGLTRDESIKYILFFKLRTLFC